MDLKGKAGRCKRHAIAPRRPPQYRTTGHGADRISILTASTGRRVATGFRPVSAWCIVRQPGPQLQSVPTFPMPPHHISRQTVSDKLVGIKETSCRFNTFGYHSVASPNLTR